MAKKRFTDIEIWDKEWFMELPPKYKCLVKYLFDKCDPSGCWKPNWSLASVHIKEKVALSDMTRLPKDQFEVLENGKIFIPDFINFQYGKLSKNSPAHNPVFLAIEKNNLSNRVFNRVFSTPKEEDKDKDKDKDKEGGAGETKIPDQKYLCPEMLKIYKIHSPTYGEDINRDYEPLGSIAKYIHSQNKLNGDPSENLNFILDEWDKICVCIQEGFYAQKSLKTVSNHIQELYNQTKYGKSQSASQSSGKHDRNAGAKSLLQRVVKNETNKGGAKGS